MTRRSRTYQVGDRVITYNAQEGTITDIVRDDDGGSFCLVRLDHMAGEYAYDFTEITYLRQLMNNKTIKAEPVLSGH
ncbi:hypothetical protein F9B85_08175 [Heliorestis acidaminivorans]|uniref:DUF2187 domain-containing protein n=1 Tax=Heliorestis acidaminivorans TaxID=553427 RepID=A0A6I0EWU3_9FIRM|nr:hypothetical protein [Heliorestis acidaminivorans]KAB2952627.1 hypothetical protein F9B85_08175 [Heliorestis acidaminivorans]